MVALSETRQGKRGSALDRCFPPTHENRYGAMSHALFLLQGEEFQTKTPGREQLARKVGQCLYSDSRYPEAECLFQEVLRQQGSRLEENPRAGALWNG